MFSRVRQAYQDRNRNKQRMLRWVFALLSASSMAVFVPTAFAETVAYQIVTNEVSAREPDGNKVEVYRFDPAVFVARVGDDVVLQIRGVKGHDHPIVLEGYNMKDVVRRNQVTTLRFHADKPGFYRLLCTAHADAAHQGPMEAYVVVTAR